MKHVKIHNADLGVVMGRFQPFHNGHLELVHQAFQFSKKVLILVGSANRCRSVKNPFTFSEREQFIINAIREAMPDRMQDLYIRPMKDYLYEENRWIQHVQEEVDKELLDLEGELCMAGKHASDMKVTIFAHNRDESSYYIRKFPQWDLIELPEFQGGISATYVRDLLAKNSDMIKTVVPFSVRQDLVIWASQGKNYSNFLAEYNFREKYMKQIETSYWPYIRQTVDAVVTCKGHILVVKRKACPGKNTWALPGGHMDNSDVSLEHAAVRELIEETNIGVKPSVLWNCMSEGKCFSHKDRSELCRTVTQAYHFPLNTGDLPALKAADDAAAAEWVTFAQFETLRNSGLIFSDHGDVASYFINRAN